MPYFKWLVWFYTEKHFEWNIRNVLFPQSNYKKLSKIYNDLNKNFSFTRHNFCQYFELWWHRAEMTLYTFTVNCWTYEPINLFQFYQFTKFYILLISFFKNIIWLVVGISTRDKTPKPNLVGTLGGWSSSQAMFTPDT